MAQGSGRHEFHDGNHCPRLYRQQRATPLRDEHDHLHDQQELRTHVLLPHGQVFVPGAAVGVIKLVDLNTPEKRALVLANAEARILAYEKAMNLQEPRSYDNFFFADMLFTQAVPAAVQAPEADDGDVFDEN